MNLAKAGEFWRDQPPSIELPEETWRKIECTLAISKPDPAFRRFLAHRVRRALSLIEGPPQIGETGGLHLGELREVVSDLGKLASKLSKKMQKSCNSKTSSDADWAFYHVTETWARQLDERYPKLGQAIEDDRKRPDLAGEKMDLFRGDFPDRPLADMPPIFFYEFAMATVADFEKACDTVVASLGKGAGGRPKNVRLQELIGQFARAYRDFTGERPTVTSDPIRYGYSGKFLAFLNASLEAFALEYCDTAGQPSLGATTQEVLCRVFPKASDKTPQ